MSSHALIENYHDAAKSAGLSIDSSDLLLPSLAVQDPQYGFVMKDNLTAATTHLRDGSDVLPLAEVPEAMSVLGYLLRESGISYRQSHDVPPSEIWDQHVENVRGGEIKLMPKEYWTSRPFGEVQAIIADTMLGNVSPGVEQVLAAFNYDTYFQPKTMAGAARTLAESPEIAASSEELESMPHLSVTNWTIGQTVQHVYEQMADDPKGKLHVIDMCSGTAATLAAITNRLAIANSLGIGLSSDRLSMLGIEATPAFFEQMVQDFAVTARPQLGRLGLRGLADTPADIFDGHLKEQHLSLVEGDVVGTIQDLRLDDISDDDVVVATVNYGFHRLPSRSKAAILSSLARAKNVIVAVGDLRKNGSNVNRGYFNLANNGPVNAGNIGLEREMALSGFIAETIGVNGFAPSFVDEILRSRLDAELENDGFVTIAYQGQKAEELVAA